MTQVDTSGGRHGISEAESGLFARQATGLVREVSPLSAAIFNFSVSLPAYILAFSVFWILGAFPGANIYAAFWFTCALAVVFCIAFGLLSSAMPRTGGDYTLVSRLIHPVVGLISSFCVCFSVTLAIGAFGLAAATVVVGPGLTAVGLVANSSSLVDAGQTVQDSEAWKFVLGDAVDRAHLRRDRHGLARGDALPEHLLHRLDRRLRGRRHRAADRRPWRLRRQLQRVRRQVHRLVELLPADHRHGQEGGRLRGARVGLRQQHPGDGRDHGLRAVLATGRCTSRARYGARAS